MKSRIRLTAPSIKSRTELEAHTREITGLIIDQNQTKLTMDAELQAVRERYEERLEHLRDQIEQKIEVTRAWAEGNPAEFSQAKSLDLVHCTIGWRTGQPTLKTLRGWTWDRVLDKMRSLGGRWTGYIRTKEEVNRQQLLIDRDALGPALAPVGLTVEQTESFFLDAKLQALENRQTG